MGCVNVTSIQILDNPAPFLNPLQFEITYECIQDLQDDLEWKVIYVGSAESETYDQVLDSILLGPVRVGVSNFVLQVDPPDVTKIPSADLLGVTAILLTGLYKGRDFIRVGYFVNNEYMDEEKRLEPPPVVDVNTVVRNILAEKPRVTRFPIPWDQDTIVPTTTTTENGLENNNNNVENNSNGTNSNLGEEVMPMEVSTSS